MVPRQESNTRVSSNLPWLRSPGLNRSEWAFTYLSQECIPLLLTACMCASKESWAVTYTEEQRGWESGGECRGCHNRKHGDITRPSGVTEADGAGMRLNYPCGIWLRHRGVLSSFPRQREEASGASFALCLLSDRAKWQQQTLRFGERGISAHSLAPSPWPEVQLVERERADESLPGCTGVGDGATCRDLPGSWQERLIPLIPKQWPQPCQVHAEPHLKELAYAFCFARASPSAAHNLSALAGERVPVPWGPSTGVLSKSQGWGQGTASGSSTAGLSYSCPGEYVEANFCRLIQCASYRALVWSHSSMRSGVCLWKNFRFLTWKCHLLQSKTICRKKSRVLISENANSVSSVVPALGNPALKIF